MPASICPLTVIVDHHDGGGAGGVLVVGRSAAAATPPVTPNIVPAQSAAKKEDLRENAISYAPSRYPCSNMTKVHTGFGQAMEERCLRLLFWDAVLSCNG
jgi:hypothetical protein